MQQFLSKTVVPDMDKVLASFLEKRHDELSPSPEARFRIKEANESLWALSQRDGDAFYDWPDIGWLYLSVYQPKRVVQLVSILDEICQQASGKKLKVWDFGCGTGAVLWALAYLQLSLRSNEKGPMSVEYYGIDASIVMLREAEKAWDCWKNSPREKAKSLEQIDATWQLNTWEQARISEDDPEELSLVTGSYLFDASDQTRQEALVRRFKEVVHTASPDWVCLTAPYQKRDLFNKWGDIMHPYKSSQPKEVVPVRDDQKLHQTIEQREKIFKKVEVRITATTQVKADESLWLQIRLYRKPMDVTQLPDAGRAWSPYHKCLSDPGIVEWTEEQREARDTNLPTVLLGAAGSGKSLLMIDRVVTELVKNEQNSLPGQRDGKILIVVQAKDVIARLSRWFEKLCRASDLEQSLKAQENRRNFKRYEPDEPESQFSVTICTFDKLVKDTLVRSDDPLSGTVRTLEKVWNDESWSAIDEMPEYKDLPPRIQDRDFFLKEYERVFHGLGADTLDEYREVKRKGVEHSNLHREHRPNMFSCLRKMHELMDEWGNGKGQRKDSWTFRRCRVREGKVTLQYDFLFIDEGQDFKKTEYQWLYGHVKDSSNTMVCEDTTQSIHTGSSAHVPPREEGMKRRKLVKVRQSIRMPYQIARFLEGLSQSVLKDQEQKGQDPDGGQVRLQASKESVPGIRPVVVHGSSRDEAVSQVQEVIRTFRRGDENGDEVWCFDDNGDKEKEFVDKFDRQDDHSRIVEGRPLLLKSVVKAKGDECSCVVWLTDGEFYGVGPTEHDEAAFTVMSRTTFLLIIVITDDTTDENWRVLSRCKSQHVMFWTEGAKNKFANKTAVFG